MLPASRPRSQAPARGRDRAATARRWLTGTWAGRALAAGLVVKLAVYAVRTAGVANGLVDSVNVLANLALIVAGVSGLVRLVRRARARLLWRVRRKLILSYIFIGVVPVLLIAAFFALAGVLVFLNTGAYLARAALERVTNEARLVADTIVTELPPAVSAAQPPAVAAGDTAGAVERPGSAGDTSAAVPSAVTDTLSRWAEKLAGRYPGASVAFVPTGPEPCVGRRGTVDGAAAPPGARDAAARPRWRPASAGAWRHTGTPNQLPGWVSCDGFAGLFGVTADQVAGRSLEDGVLLVARAAALPPGALPTYAVVVDIPVGHDLLDRLRAETTVKMGAVSLIDPALGSTPDRAAGTGGSGGTAAATREGDAAGGSRKRRITWVAILERVEWATGRAGQAVMTIDVSLRDIYDTLSPARLGSYTFGSVILGLLFLLAVLFLIIEAAALLMGLLLARSITGSIHEIFDGTERVRSGDIGHRITVTSDDQLGALAVSFNEMTSSITSLLREAEEKKRLEEELRIARTVQMSLLPRGDLVVPGLTVTAVCLPAREVGGDYFDFFRLDDGRLGLLIADVSGKGTSAAFYMAELKGLMLSLTRIHRSPKAMLIEANRIISEHLDSRSFITATYAVIDVPARRMVYARAGHTPLIHYCAHHPCPGEGRDTGVRILVPDGLVLGLRLDGGRMFESLLEEATLTLEPDDLLVFFTDGISEAMNPSEECFGEARLGDLVAAHGRLPSEALRERILDEVERFVDGAPQHDDMTMILVKVGGTEGGDGESGFGDRGIGIAERGCGSREARDDGGR